MDTCLISVDLQEAYLGDRDLEPARGRLLAGASGWLTRFRERELPIVHVRTTVPVDGPALPHWNRADRQRLRRGEDTWQFASPAAPEDGEPIVEKTHYSGFQSGRLLQLLTKIGAREVVVIGVHLHGCVRSTALDASAAGLGVTIGLDAIASNDPPHAAATRRWMSERGFRLAALRDWAPGTPGAAPGQGPALVAARRAADAFAGWSASAPERRVAALEPLGGLLRENARRLADAMAAGIHKPVAEAEAEISYAADLADHAVARAADAVRPAAGGVARRVPNGPTLLVTPWNNPVAIPVGKIVPALALGNTAVWKPSPRASSVSAALHDVLRALDLPDGSLERVEGGPDEVAALVREGGIRAVSLSGSLEAGRALHDLCAAELIPLQAELGGNNAAVVCADAEIAEAAKPIAAGAFGFAGQRCTATRRAIVVGDAQAPLSRALRAEVEGLRAGDPREEASTFGPVVSHSAAARTEALLERARAAGAGVWRPRWAEEPAFGELGRAFPFVAPAVVENAHPDSEVVREESFGPVLILMAAPTLAEAIRLCNDVPQGLVASIHTRSSENVARFTREARAGILKVNQPTAGADASLPFGGFGLSGLGPPEHGEGDAEFHTQWQAIYGPPAPSPDVAGATPLAGAQALSGGRRG